MMKRIISGLLAFILLGAVFPAAFAAGSMWTCPTCGGLCEDNYCPEDGTAKPQVRTLSKTVKAGDYVTFGCYPQTASGTDQTPIEWQVLEVKGNTALLLSRYVLDYQPFNAKIRQSDLIDGSVPDEELSWERSTLREWLNGDFYYTAFAQEEKKSIINSTLNNVRDDTGAVFYDGGVKLRDTQDRVFMMSFLEADRYFEWDNELCMDSNTVAKPTEYAVSRGAYELTWEDADLFMQLYGDVFSPGQPPIGACGWWLRDFCGCWVYQVDAIGGVDINACMDVFENHGVRPAIWVKLG